MTCLHAVLVPLSTRLARARRFPAAREALAEALRAGSELAGAPRSLPCDAWPRAASGAPAAVGGWRASFTDTTGLAAALVAPLPVGLDAEWLRRPRWEAARERFRASGELALHDADDAAAVLALWTAKEALLKLAGVGLGDLARCPLLRRDGELFRLEHRGREHEVLVRSVGEHVLACASAVPAELALHVLEPVA
jgi:hypothetical protein